LISYYFVPHFIDVPHVLFYFNDNW